MNREAYTKKINELMMSHYSEPSVGMRNRIVSELYPELERIAGFVMVGKTSYLYDAEDLAQLGAIHLIEKRVIERYEPREDCTPLSYLRVYFEGAMRNALRREATLEKHRVVQAASHESDAYDLEDYVEPPGTPEASHEAEVDSLLERWDYEQDLAALVDAVGEETSANVRLIRDRFISGASQSKVARDFGVTQQAISERELRIKQRLVKAVEESRKER